MTDGVIKGVGDSRYLKTVAHALALYPTYEDFIIALVSGTFPIDLNGINPLGWDTIGDKLNKDTLLKDTTAQAAGLTDQAVPDDVLKWLVDKTNGVRSIATGGTGNATGNASSATKLQTARTIQTNLASGAAASFNGTANVTPGVTGILPISSGGTGATSLSGIADAVIPYLSGISKISAGSYVGTDSTTIGLACTFPLKFGIIMGRTSSSTLNAQNLPIVLIMPNYAVSFHQGYVNVSNTRIYTYEADLATTEIDSSYYIRLAFPSKSKIPNVSKRTNYYAIFG